MDKQSRVGSRQNSFGIYHFIESRKDKKVAIIPNYSKKFLFQFKSENGTTFV